MVQNPKGSIRGVPQIAEYLHLPEAIIETVQLPLLVLDDAFVVVRTNPAFCRHFQVRSEETVGRPLEGLGNGQWNIAELQRLLEEIIPRHGHVEDYRIEHEFPSLGRRVMLLNAHRIDGMAERPDLILLAISDVTDQERALYELEGQREYGEKLIDSIREALVVLGWDLRVKHANAPFYTTFKVTPAETEGRLIYEIGNRQWDIPALRRLLEDILPKEQSFDDFEVTHEFDNIGNRHMLLNARRLDHLNLILLAIEDVTERDASHRRQRMLASEMSHRVKNILTLVDSISAQTASSVSSLDDFQVVFHGRLTALARSHGQWLADDMQTASLHDLLEEVSESSGLDRERITLEGPPVAVKPTQTMALNLSFHELCTNAIKYGAISTDAGHIDVTWSVSDGQIRLTWREIGGPAVKPPSSKGFGLQLIESLCPFELDGAAEVRFERSGLQCDLRFPVS